MYDRSNIRLLIATPTHDGNLGYAYVNSLVRTLKKNINISIDTYFLAHDSLIQSARNKIFQYALKNAYDYTLFIDADISWDSNWIEKMIGYNKHVISGVYRTKTDDIEEYAVNYHPDKIKLNKEGLAKVSGVGFGFIMLSREAIETVWTQSGSEPYYDYGSHTAFKNIFEVKIVENEMHSEDIVACKKIRDCGFDIFIDPEMECVHTGSKKYYGDFKKRFKNV